MASYTNEPIYWLFLHPLDAFLYDYMEFWEISKYKYKYKVAVEPYIWQYDYNHSHGFRGKSSGTPQYKLVAEVSKKYTEYYA